ncbi:MAG: diguanylate cyclase [Armatimonadetes bacterium]|nr:diguanylate cyclase [Armatimonadota bacterium]
MLALRMYVRYGRRRAWLLLSLNFMVWLVRSGLALHHLKVSPHLPSLLADLPQAMLGCLSAALLLSGLALMDGVHRAAEQAEQTLRHEKRHLTMLVDRRVADLEAEVTERAHVEEELRRDGDRFSAIIATQQDIATADLDLDAVMDLIVTRAQALTGASGAVLKLAEGDAVVFRAASGRAAPHIGLRVPKSAGLTGECLRTGQVLRCDDAERDPLVNRDVSRRTGSRSVIIVPLYHHRRVIGVLSVMSPERHAFGPTDVHTLQLMAGLTAAAMSHAAEFEAKQELLAEAIERAERDPLTGLLNHRAFHKRLEEEADRAQREGTSLAVAVLDLDNFKFFNDTYGHITGDDVLRRIATALQEGCRPTDILARYGGDEFALLVPDVRSGGAAQVAARLTAHLEGLGYQPPAGGTQIPLVFSVGVALFPDEGATRLEVIELADARLRRAKTGAGDGARALDMCATLARSLEGFSMLDALVTAVDNKDRYTHRHCEDVLAYSLEIARELELDEKTQRVVATAALLHDVGKIGVPDAILRKPGRLTEAESGAVQQHPMMGAIIVGAVPGFEGTLDAIRHHHERWDGGGYPGGLCGEEIPFLARLMAVADAYSAMTTDRPYRKGMCPAQALSVLEQGAGTQWDPECVHAFLRTRRRAVEPRLTAHEASLLPLAA